MFVRVYLVILEGYPRKLTPHLEYILISLVKMAFKNDVAD